MDFFDKVHFINSITKENFVGLKYKNNKIHIYLPLGFDIPKKIEEKNYINEIKAKIILLLKSISLIKSIDTSSLLYGKENELENEIPFDSFLWIINDYVNNGLYQKIDKTYNKYGKGKINWKRTLNGEHYFSNNNIVYLNPYYETNYQKDNLITELNNYCLKISNNYIGFLFGNIKTPYSNMTMEIVSLNKKYYLNIINKELIKTFNERKKTLLLHMKKVIDMTSNENYEMKGMFGTYKYEYVWEKLVNYTLGTKELNIKDYFPQSYWNIINKKREKDISRLKPDTILKDIKNNKIYILDAKYYKYGITSNMKDLPHTDSIQKQITYGDHIANNFNYSRDNIYNAFIIPYNKNKNAFELSNNIEYLGFAESDWRKKFYNYERIALILVDTQYILNCYFKKEISDIKKLIESIEKVKK